MTHVLGVSVCISLVLQGQRLARADGLAEDLDDADDADAESEGPGPASAGAEEGEEEEVPVAVVGGFWMGNFMIFMRELVYLDGKIWGCGWKSDDFGDIESWVVSLVLTCTLGVPKFDPYSLWGWRQSASGSRILWYLLLNGVDFGTASTAMNQRVNTPCLQKKGRPYESIVGEFQVVIWLLLVVKAQGGEAWASPADFP